MTPSCMLGIQLTLFAHLTHLSEVEYTLVYTKHLLGVSKQGKHNTVSYFYINIFKFLKILSSFFHQFHKLASHIFLQEGWGGRKGRGTWVKFAWYVPLASQNPYPTIVNSVAHYRPYCSHFLENAMFAIPI